MSHPGIRRLESVGSVGKAVYSRGLGSRLVGAGILTAGVAAALYSRPARGASRRS